MSKTTQAIVNAAKECEVLARSIETQAIEAENCPALIEAEVLLGVESTRATMARLAMKLEDATKHSDTPTRTILDIES